MSEIWVTAGLNPPLSPVMEKFHTRHTQADWHQWMNKMMQLKNGLMHWPVQTVSCSCTSKLAEDSRLEGNPPVFFHISSSVKPKCRSSHAHSHQQQARQPGTLRRAGMLDMESSIVPRWGPQHAMNPQLPPLSCLALRSMTYHNFTREEGSGQHECRALGSQSLGPAFDSSSLGTLSRNTMQG